MAAQMRTEFKGACIGVTLTDRATDDLHQLVTLSVEDDGCWFKKMTFSSFWLDEAIAKLSEAREELQAKAAPDPTGFGYVRQP